jgi:hypothetical protein
MVVGEDVAPEVVKQPAFDIKTHTTTSPLLSAVDEYVELLIPTLAPFTCH